ncbi:MAG: hypothetical protein IKW74_01015, partial [Thermoguttaceae bacterium]|nr:hypothetical protein [Thermoguttaceae bacterium]
ACVLANTFQNSQFEPGNIHITTTVEPEHVNLTDDVYLTLNVSHDATCSLMPLTFGDGYGDFDVVGVQRSSARIENGIESSRIQLKLRPVKSGTLTFGEIPLTFKRNHSETLDNNYSKTSNNNGQPGNGSVSDDNPSQDDTFSVTLPSGTVDVTSSRNPDSVSLDEIRSFQERIYPVPYLWYLGIAVVLAGIVFLIWKLVRRARNKKHMEKPVLARELALLRLKHLEESNIAARDIKTFYLEITSIIRWYIEQVTDILAGEKTTEEFLQEINASGADFRFNADTRQYLASFLEFADLVKFARHTPDKMEIKEGFRNAKSFVMTFQATDPEPEKMKNNAIRPDGGETGQQDVLQMSKEPLEGRK